VSVIDEVNSTAVVVRVADRERTVMWFREVFKLEPVMAASDGADHPIALYRVCGLNFAVWQLPPGITRDRADNKRNSFVTMTHPDPRSARDTLVAAGADVGPVSGSEHHVFFYLHDPDGNRYEITSPPTASYADK
jgi:catechol 2,3-dioxygenase-like lactoylglutathione lyase family enzyme